MTAWGPIRVRVNGTWVEERNARPTMRLLDWLRDEHGCSSVKEGCGTGACGACTVHMSDSEGAWRPVLACLVPLALAHGRSVRTMEGMDLSDGTWAALNQDLQCGFCGPGLHLAVTASADEPVGNLCRCTGYAPFQKHRARVGCGPLSACPGERLPTLWYRSDDETWIRPTSLGALWRLLKKHPSACIVAGATDQRAPGEVRVALDGIETMSRVRQSGRTWNVGAATTLARMLDYPVPEILRVAILGFGSPQVRSLATIGGSLCAASPAGDLAPALMVLDAQVEVGSPRGRRTIPLETFFTGPRTTSLSEGEVLLSVRFNSPQEGLFRFRRVTRRRAMDVSIASVAVGLGVDPQGTIKLARIAMGSVGPTPLRARQAEAWLMGRALDPTTLRAAAEMATGESHPMDDPRCSGENRRELVFGLLAGILEPAVLRNDEQRPVAPKQEGGKDDLPSFLADEPPPRGMLHAVPVPAPFSLGRLNRVRPQGAFSVDGVVALLTAHDIPGANSVGLDEPLLADAVVAYHAQPVAVVLARTRDAGFQGRDLVVVEGVVAAPIIGIAEAEVAESWHGDPYVLEQGTPDASLADAPLRLQGEVVAGAQEHLYLETQVSRAYPSGDGGMTVRCSTQHPARVQRAVARVLGVGAHAVTVEVPSMGGGFGGKETQATRWACIAALAAAKTGRPVECRLDRGDDIAMTGKRHPMRARWAVGFKQDGRILAYHVDLLLDGGAFPDISQAAMERALHHLDNAYFIPSLRFIGRVACTSVVPSTACRGFGVPQAILITETVMDRIAAHLGRDPIEVRRANLYGRDKENRAPWGEALPALPFAALVDRVLVDQDRVRAEVDAFNLAHRTRRRAWSIVPIRFGIGFSNASSNQATARVQALLDGTVQVFTGGADLGQGLPARLRSACASTLAIPAGCVRVMPLSTASIPNASATAASSTADLSGEAAVRACRDLADRIGWAPGSGNSFEEVCQKAWQRRIDLVGVGHFDLPEVDRHHHPFRYYALGAARVVVEVDLLTKEWRLIEADLFQDVGHSREPEVDEGQVRGGFVQGMGWLTSEQVLWDPEGRMLTHDVTALGPPTMADVRGPIRVHLLDLGAPGGGLLGARAVGEPPLVMGVAVRRAIEALNPPCADPPDSETRQSEAP